MLSVPARRARDDLDAQQIDWAQKAELSRNLQQSSLYGVRAAECTIVAAFRYVHSGVGFSRKIPESEISRTAC
jgi:hypothetical protein